MIDLLVSVIIATCPPTDDIKTTECHERITNCAVKEGGRIDENTIKECIDDYVNE